MDLRVKPNCRAGFDLAEFSVVCGNDHAAWPFGGDSAREVSPPCDFSQHDNPKGKRPFGRFPMQTASLVCAPCFIALDGDQNIVSVVSIQPTEIRMV